MTIEDMIVEMKTIRKLHHDYMTQIASTVEIWTTMIEDFPEMRKYVIEDMRHLSAHIREITGVKNES